MLMPCKNGASNPSLGLKLTKKKWSYWTFPLKFTPSVLCTCAKDNFTTLTNQINIKTPLTVNRGVLWEEGGWWGSLYSNNKWHFWWCDIFRRALLWAEAWHSTGQWWVRGSGPGQSAAGDHSSVYSFVQRKWNVKTENNAAKCHQTLDLNYIVRVCDDGLWTRNNFIQFIKIMYTDTSAGTLRSVFAEL